MSDLLKKLLYASGALGLYHRWRNARTLTVIMFHRVLGPKDPRWAGSDPDYTLPSDRFSQCLEFFAAHYNMVSAPDVLRARRGEFRLPARALLITFDDGWLDNLDFALPQLRARHMPSLMFVVADAVGRDAPFHQEQIVGAWRRGTIDTIGLAAALRGFTAEVATPEANDAASLRRLIVHVDALDLPRRAQLLDALAGALQDGLRHMVNPSDLGTLEAGGMAIGVHGKTHTPMTCATDLDAELAGARAELAIHLPRQAVPQTMSFPHGRYDATIAERALAAGYELLFTSVPVVNRTDVALGGLLGRLGFETDAVVDPHGRFRPDWLALYLFTRSRRALA